MDAESVKRELLEYGWDAAERRRILELLTAAETDPECQAALAEYDAIRRVLRQPAIESDIPVSGDDQAVTRLPQATMRRSRRALRNVALAAAVLLAAVLNWQAYRSMSGRAPQSSEVNLAGLAFTAHDIKRDVGVFQEVAEVFEQQAAWVMMSDEESDMGLDGVSGVGPEHLLLVRLAACRGDNVVSSTDVVVVPGQKVSVKAPLEMGQRIRYEVSTTRGAARLSIRAVVETADGEQRMLAAMSTNLQVEPGGVYGAGEMVTTSGAYSLNVAYAEGALPGGGS